MERQLTFAPSGHVLTNVGAWSHDGEWIVYDVRSDAAGSVFDGTRIERVHIATGEVEVLYESRCGACCGVVTCSPVDERVSFILGPENPTPDWSYCPWHRRGVIVDARRPGEVQPIDACDVTPPFTPGALRGGSHVHVFSGDGAWISFTYEDHVLASPNWQAAGGAGGDFNQRNIGVSVSAKPVRVPRTHPRNYDGDFFSVLATRTVNSPRLGSDEISRAYEDAWVGTRGYLRVDGTRQARALAFLGDVVDGARRRQTEVFIVDLPEDVTRAGDGPLEGTADRRPTPPAWTRQRRLSFSEHRTGGGVCGVRHWPRSSPDGSQIAFLMRDDAGVVQLWTVSPLGGAPRQVTYDPWDVASAFTWDGAGRRIAYVADRCVMTVDVATGRSVRLTAFGAAEDGPRPEACVFSPAGERVAFVRQVTGTAGRFSQVFVVDAR